jgi:predicted aconitase with swiveling domain
MTDAGWIARSVVKGVAEGPALVSRTALSFLGDLDIRSGRVVGRSSDLCGERVCGRVLVLPETRGSAGAWRFLYQLKVHGTHPAALVLRDMPDPSVTQGAILAEIPVLVAPPEDFWITVRNDQTLRVDALEGRITRL